MTSNILSKVFAAAIVGAGLIAAPASYAGSFVPETEGEVEIKLADVEDGGFDGCIDTDQCITSLPGIASIKSLVNATTGTASRLFVDTIGTLNEYAPEEGADPSFNDDVRLKPVDVGTNPAPFVFRPSTDEERGQLEVGTFEINFTETIDKLLVKLFDVEASGTAILAVNGEAVADGAIEVGGDDSIASRMYSGVTSIILQLGRDYAGSTGDGVSFTLESVPEPGAIIGLSIVAGGMLLKRRQEAEA